MKLTIDGHVYELVVGAESVTIGDRTFDYRIEGEGAQTTVIVAGKRLKVHRWSGGDGEAPDQVNVDGKVYDVTVEGAARAASRPSVKKAKAPAVAGAVTALMPGRVVRLAVDTGQQVEVGDVLLVLEAMKMENEIRAEAAGTVASVAVQAGASVAAGDTLLVIE
jgi:biotin carboxyl carrier protein